MLRHEPVWSNVTARSGSRVYCFGVAVDPLRGRALRGACRCTVTMENRHMYEAPKLTRFGKFRDLTLQGPSKNTIGDDLVPGVGMDCSSTANPNDPRACRS